MNDNLTKTVYSLIYPETENILLSLWKDQPLELYHKAYGGGSQGESHEIFLNTYKEWVQKDVTLPILSFQYPTAGSSEAIRESLALYASKHPGGTIHVFQGEYEGYEALARGYGLNTVKHDRNDLSTLSIPNNEPFYISQPSSIDGCFWEKFDDFLSIMKDHSMVRVDICYIGATTKSHLVNLNHNCIDMIFFSLSKTYGVYFHRIGGVFSKEEIPGLWGNQWFKNVFSLKLGTTLLKNYSCGELPRKYAHHQEEIKTQLESHQGISLEKSDVLFLLKTSSKTLPEFSRNDQWSRICITPLIDRIFR